MAEESPDAHSSFHTRLALLELRMAQSDKVGDEHSEIFRRLAAMEGDIKVILRTTHSNGQSKARREIAISGGLATGIIFLAEAVRTILI